MTCRCALLFVTPFDSDTRAVDLATGRYGYGHVALWGGQLARDHEPIVLDAAIDAGVTMRRLRAMTRGAPYRRAELDDDLGCFIFQRACAQIGRPYDFAGLARRRLRSDRFTCSGLIAACLPQHLRDRIEVRRRPIAPNDLARLFGVPSWPR